MILQKHLGFFPTKNHSEFGQCAHAVSGAFFKDIKVGRIEPLKEVLIKS